MWINVIQGILIPFAGTTLGAACVFFLRRQIGETMQKTLAGFASGVMVAASFFGLLIPSMEQASELGRLSFIPAVVGFLIGMLFLLALDKITPHIHLDKSEEGPKSGLRKTTKLILAVTLHNIPEGMAVGIVFASFIYASKTGEPVNMMSAMALAIGIAIQNFPEGAIVSMPLRAEGMAKSRTFLCGMLTGIVEPLAAIITIFAASMLLPVMPYLLSFAAGAMMYVVVEELIPDMKSGEHSNAGTVAFALGLVVMMALDVGLG